MATYTVAQLYAAARAAGFTPSQAVVATAISLAENGSRNAFAISPRNADGSYDHGAWQINDKANADIIKQYGDVNNLVDNAKMAHAVYQRQGWSAWTTYTSGAYKAHMPTAVKASKSKSVSLLDVLLPGALAAGGAPPGAAVGAAEALTSGGKQGMFASLTNLADHLTSGAFWMRIGIGIGAAVLILIGVAFMLESNKTVRGATVKAAEVGAVA